MRLTVKAGCKIQMVHFPMDSQLCTLEIESYGYTMADLSYTWNKELKAVDVGPDVSFHTFIL